MATLLLEDRYFRLNPEIDNWGLDDTRHLNALKVKANSDFTRDFGEILKKIKKRSAQQNGSVSGPIRGELMLEVVEIENARVKERAYPSSC